MKKYGLTERFATLATMYPELCVGRIISQDKGLYQMVSEQGIKLAEVSGKFRYNAEKVSDYPAVGDFVIVDWNEEGGNAIIHHILHRKSSIMRKAAGNANREQVIATNIDTIFLCMSLNNDFNIRRLERYLSIAWDSGATPVVVLTKSDLCTDLEDKLLDVSSVAFGVDILVTTTIEESGFDEIKPYICDGKTVAFIGSSGVGKSTLINCLLGEHKMDTNGLRDDDKGRHTTTHRELILLPDGGMVIDTPGMRELGMMDSEAGIGQTFEDIEMLAQQCRFSDCSHSTEPGCAVKQALENGQLAEERWQSYLKLKLENEYATDSQSYLISKEKKFKEIAKYNKSNRKR